MQAEAIYFGANDPEKEKLDENQIIHIIVIVVIVVVVNVDVECVYGENVWKWSNVRTHVRAWGTLAIDKAHCTTECAQESVGSTCLQFQFKYTKPN